MRRLLALLAGVALIAGALWMVLREPRTTSGVGAPPDAGSAAARDVELTPAVELEAPGKLEQEASERALVASDEPAAAEEPESTEDALAATIHGRFLLPGGEPAAGVQLDVHGWGANTERELKFGVPEDWVDPAGESGPDGSFAFRFEPPRAFQFTLDAKLDGYCETSWRWSEILPGRSIDVGDVVLERGGAIEGRIVDGEGNPLPGDGWRIYADSTEASASGRDSTRVRTAADPETGRFRVEGMPPGRARLKAHNRMANWVDGPSVAVVGGETVEATIVYDGPSFANRITVTTFSRPFYVMNDPDPASIKLYSGDGEARVAKKIPQSSQSYTFDDLEPGVYTVEIDDPSYELWRESGVRTGTEVRAHLVGNAALHLDVRDAETDEPVELYKLRVRFRKVSFSPAEFEVHDGSEPLPGRVFRGMFPGSYALTVTAEGYGPSRVLVDDLLAGETRPVSVPLGSPTFVAGTVTSADRPAAGAEVLLLRPADVDDSAESPILRSNTITSDAKRHRRELQAASADAEGRFEFPIAAAGTYVVHASRGVGIEAVSDPFHVSLGGRKEVSLSLVAPGKLVGRVVSPAGASPRGLRVWVRPEKPAGSAHLMFPSFRNDTTVLDEDGAFATGPLAPGDVSVYLFLPERFYSGLSTTGADRRPGGAIELGRVTIPEGEVVERDFVLADDFPGSVQVTAFSHGVPLDGVQVALVSADMAQLTATTGPDGRADPIPAFPGTWALHVSGSNGWKYRHPERVEVRSGERVELDVDVEATEATLVFRDAITGDPLANRRIGCHASIEDRIMTGIRYIAPLSTDGDGRLTLTLSPGEYRFELVGAKNAASGRREATLRWTADGPEVTELHL